MKTLLNPFLSSNSSVRIVLYHCFQRDLLLSSTHVSFFKEVLLWKLRRSSLNWSRSSISSNWLWCLPILFDHLHCLVILVQFTDVVLPSFKYLQFVVHIMRVDVFIKREWVRDFHLQSFVGHYLIINIKRTFLTFGNHWILDSNFLTWADIPADFRIRSFNVEDLLLMKVLLRLSVWEIKFDWSSVKCLCIGIILLRLHTRVSHIEIIHTSFDLPCQRLIESIIQMTTLSLINNLCD